MYLKFFHRIKRRPGFRFLSKILLCNRSIFLAALIFTGCILQGPWDYSPDEATIHRGLWVNALIIADRPVTDICIEKLLELDEEYTDAFKFYRNADVSITGSFNGTENTLNLTQDMNRVNCFTDPLGLLPSKGEDYRLNARITWDSAGGRVNTRISALAHIPTMFNVRNTARAPAVALTGLSIDTSATDSSQADMGFITNLLDGLPEEGQNKLQEIYLDTLTAIFESGDTAAFEEFLELEMPNIIKIVNEYTIEYSDGDTLFYLTG